MWCELIRSLHYGKDCSFAAPASSADLAKVEKVLGVTLPGELRSLLTETNGVTWHYVPRQRLEVIWSTRLLIKHNRRYRQESLEFASLLAFADVGPAVYSLNKGKSETPRVTIHSMGRSFPDLRAYLESHLAEG